MLETRAAAARLIATVLALALGPVSDALAQLPPGVFAGSRDYRLAPAATYAVDPTHTAVIARVSHIGYALSVFRFDRVAGSLTWDPGQPAKSDLKVSVETASISTPVAGFAAELAGPEYLKSAAFPTATFVSTSFRQIDANHGRVAGQLTLMGRTHPLTFDVSPMGAGKGIMGHARLGAQATARIDPQAYGMNPLFATPIELKIDAEFAQTP